MNVSRPHAIRFQTGVAEWTDITQFTRVEPNRNYEEIVERSASEAAPQFTGAVLAVPDVTFDTRQCKSLLDLCSTSGVLRAYSASADGTVSLYYRRGANRGLRADPAATVHDRFDMVDNAMLYWTRLRAESRGLAEISARVLPVSNGLINPLVHVGSSALAASSAVAHLYTLAKVEINGTTISGLKSSDIDNGFSADEEDSDGSPYLTFASIDEWNPRWTGEVQDLGPFADFDADGEAVTSFTCYFRKLQKNGIFVPDGTAEHLKITATAGTVRVDQARDVKARSTITVLLEKPAAGTDPFVVNTAAAIT